ncbi:Reticulon family protein [Perilla frutescens var. hirtella]|uniref:Reticulon-like protein n=1 Tax=Perilla frutescens var. hirtella TaxID=608512 RepID=A0AAD4P6E8_PERFH|nr:Reticulon family protein [Perilla frutescens var. frutescens]KAH6827517.1 Reticulon family protein [Perilla frutescens var. hirtella]
MENSNAEDLCSIDSNVEATIDDPASTNSSYKLFGRQAAGHEMVGGGQVDVMLWRRYRVSFGLVVATLFWILIERSGIPFLSLCSDVLLILVVLLFLQSSYAGYRNKKLPILPELVLSEEMVNNAAASFRAKVNYMLLMAHDITLGKDFRLFFKVVIALWLLSVIGSLISFVTLAYIGIIVSIIVPALYDKFQDRVDRCVGTIHRQFSKHYKIVDESLHSRLPGALAKDKNP